MSRILPDGLYAALAKVDPYNQQAELTASNSVEYSKTVGSNRFQGVAYVFVAPAPTATP